MTAAPVSLTVRFWEKVPSLPDSECWEWGGSRNNTGYGLVYARNSLRLLAHRVSYELASTSQIPSGMEVCHTCDNPPCVNPKHLFLADHAANMQDSKSKGRTRGPSNLHGEANPAARLSATDVREIRRLYRRGLTIALIARRFLTAESNVSSIVKRQTWKEVS